VALEIYLEGTLNGEALAETENATTTAMMGGDDVSEMVECLSLSTGIETPTQHGGFRRTGRRELKPVEITFRGTGKTWPQWLKGCDRNEEFQGTFHLYRTSLTEGNTEKCGTIVLTRGRVLSVRYELPNTLDPETASLPLLTHVSIAYHTMTWTAEDGTEHVVTWNARR
jgi:type VI secretion system Hcp family effector